MSVALSGWNAGDDRNAGACCFAAVEGGACSALQGRTIGIMAPLLAGPFFSKVVSGITRAAAGAGASVVGIQTLEAVPDNLEHQNDSPTYRHLMGLRQFAGVITLLAAVPPDHLQHIVATGTHVVSVANKSPGVACPVVAADNRSGIEAALGHLILDHGHRRIGFVGDLAQDDIRERYAAYQAVLRKHGIRPERRLLFEVEDNLEAGGLAAAQALLAAGLPCSAVAAATDYNAIGLMAEMQRAGVVIGRDLAVVGFDDVDEASALVPALSTVRQHLSLLGSTAFGLLEQLAAGKPVSVSRRHRLPTSFVRRSSCGCPSIPATDPLLIAGTAPEPPRRRLRRLVSEAVLEPGALPAVVADAEASIEQLAALLETTGPTPPSRLEATVGRIAAHVQRFEQITAIVAAVREFAASPANDEAGRPRERLCGDLALVLTHRFLSEEAFEKHRVARLLTDEHRLSLDLLQRSGKDPRRLDFLAATPARAGCLVLWRDRDPASEVLEVAAVYRRAGDSPISPGDAVPLEEFPPLAFSSLADSALGELTLVVPMRTEHSDWGALAVVSGVEEATITRSDVYFQCASLLSAALGEEVLESSLLERQEQLRRQHEDLRRSEERYELAATAASDGLWDYDVTAGTMYFSDRWKELVGCTAGEVGTSPYEWLGRVHPLDAAPLAASLSACLEGHSDSLLSEHRLRTADGSYRWTRCRALAVPGAPAPAQRLVGSTTDITVQWEFEQRLRHQAEHDELTGLPNRSLVLERARSLLDTRSGKGERVVALFVDLDDFKEVNDSLGHGAGDELLVEVARRIRLAAPDPEAVGRLGGDEFVVLVVEREGVSGPGVAERLRAALREPFVVGGREHLVSASIGIAPTAGEDVEQLLRDADIAMYQAKFSGKDRHVVFQPEMQIAARERLRLEMELAEAVVGRQLRVVYQPVLELENLAVCGVEALVRWDHPRLGLLGPASFIAAAENHGRLILELDRFVLREACAAARRWEDEQLPVGVAVNLSARHLDSEDLLADVADALGSTGLAPGRLTLEVTETAIMRDVATVVERLTRLKRLGVRVAVDDFGTGYSSLACLHCLPVDVLKIDRSFISSLPGSAKAEAVVQTLVRLGQMLELEIVAEGVETVGQLHAMRAAGCHRAQGFLFAEPLPEHQVAPFVVAMHHEPGRRDAVTDSGSVDR